MAKKPSTPKKTRKKSKSTNKKRRYAVVFAFVLLGVLFVTYWTLMQGTEAVEYKKTQNVRGMGGKMQVDIPRDMELTQSGVNILDYQHLQAGDAQHAISHIRAESQFLGEEKMKDVKAEISSQLKSKSGKYFDFFRQKSSVNATADNLIFNEFQDYNSANLKEALITDFSYDYNDVKVEGNVLIAFSEDTIYIVTLEAVDETWQSNTAFWQKVLASLKLN